MLRIECDWGTHATSGVALELTRQIYGLVSARQVEAAHEVQRRVTHQFDTRSGVADFP
jgi:hypothetical protein